MPSIPIPEPKNFRIYFEFQQIKDILVKLDSIDAFTSSDCIYAITSNIRKILNKDEQNK